MNLKAVQEVLLRISQLVIDIPDIEEMDINPLMAFPGKRPCLGVDGRIKITL